VRLETLKLGWKYFPQTFETLPQSLKNSFLKTKKLYGVLQVLKKFTKLAHNECWRLKLIGWQHWKSSVTQGVGIYRWVSGAESAGDALGALVSKKELSKSELFKHSIERCSFQFTYPWRGAHTKLTSCTCFYLALGRSFFNDFLCSNIVIWKQHVEKRWRKHKPVCHGSVALIVPKEYPFSLWDWHAIFSFNLLDVSTCCSLLQFVAVCCSLFSISRNLSTLLTQSTGGKKIRAPFPVEFLHGKRVGAFCECCMPGNTLWAGHCPPLHLKWLFIWGTPHILGVTWRIRVGYADP
jgi:hypothetical protein